MATRRLLPYFLTNVKASSEIDMLHSIFRMSPATVFVGGLANTSNESAIKNIFSPFGDVVAANVVVDKNSGMSRGIAFVTFSNLSSASDAVAGLNNREVEGQLLRVRLQKVS